MQLFFWYGTLDQRLMHQDCQPIQICVEDTLVWNPTTNGCFSCKAAMRYRSAEVNWNKLVWDTAIIPKRVMGLRPILFTCTTHILVLHTMLII